MPSVATHPLQPPHNKVEGRERGSHIRAQALLDSGVRESSPGTHFIPLLGRAGSLCPELGPQLEAGSLPVRPRLRLFPAASSRHV